MSWFRWGGRPGPTNRVGGPTSTGEAPAASASSSAAAGSRSAPRPPPGTYARCQGMLSYCSLLVQEARKMLSLSNFESGATRPTSIVLVFARPAFSLVFPFVFHRQSLPTTSRRGSGEQHVCLCRATAFPAISQGTDAADASSTPANRRQRRLWPQPGAGGSAHPLLRVRAAGNGGRARSHATQSPPALPRCL